MSESAVRLVEQFKSVSSAYALIAHRVYRRVILPLDSLSDSNLAKLSLRLCPVLYSPLASDVIMTRALPDTRVLTIARKLWFRDRCVFSVFSLFSIPLQPPHSALV